MDSLYMFAIMPPADLAMRINREREIFSEKYKCVKALKPPVHITLYGPFKASIEIEQQILGIRHWAEKQQAFQIELKNYGFFDNPAHPVVYIDIDKNEHLNNLHKSFRHELTKYMEVKTTNDKYTPHFTIGYRDVSPALFPAIKDEYSRRHFNSSFLCSALYFWKHDFKNWQIQHEFVLGGNTI